MRALKLILLALLALPSAALAQSAADEAGDISEVDKDRVGPLRERIRPVSGNLLLKNRRFELSPALTISTKDAFYTKYILGASLTYHLMETVGISGRLGVALPVVSGAAQICEIKGANRQCTPPTLDQLDKNAPGKILLVGGVEGQWAPIYGKISLVAERFLHFDMYGIGGAQAVQYLGPRGPAFTAGANLGLGMRFVVNRWSMVRVELRDLVYLERLATQKDSLRNQMLVDFGFSIFLPTTFQEG